MNLDDKFIPVRNAIYDIVGYVFKKMAQLSGYPEIPGMPMRGLKTVPDEVYREKLFLNSLPVHKVPFPPFGIPETWLEVLFGTSPKPETIPRYIYETKEEGFYNFYVENYKNLYFLPDSLSEFLQVRLNICLDISVLEAVREALFIGIVIFIQLIALRILITWLMVINPYTIPWCYLLATVDWADELLQGFVPSILGVNLTSTIMLGIIGSLGDGLNHLVLTMPFLPSEGERAKLVINQEMKDVLIFHYLPITWYRHPIPNDLREFWYYERPDILEYMQRAYKDLDIQFLPDDVIQQLNQKSSEIITQTNTITNHISTELVSQETLFDLTTFLKSFSLDFLF